MRILYIGDPNLLSDVISKNISAKDGYEIHLLTPQELEHQNFAYNEPPYELSIIDLDSTLDGEINYVRQIRSKNISTKKIVLRSDSSETDTEQLREAGADQILPVEKIDIEDLIQSIEDLTNN